MTQNDAPRAPLGPDAAEVVSRTLQALASPTRFRIVDRLRLGALTVGDIASAIDVEPSAVSHQLRLLREAGIVRGRRVGRSVMYALFDDHLEELIEQTIQHAEHVRLAAVNLLKYETE
ncbi:ArsR/SmtB family transcription factor [Arthrobacter woluwensis]|uniref:ArsR/SmtB family transcription factor n=1 Tax=Arthrobacter woluwensis TaxID=156980 RepID=UPI001FD3BE38|nr:metalloregulator ArsR/SmtB family transcription factor [Arthrobacter woluwensis]